MDLQQLAAQFMAMTSAEALEFSFIGGGDNRIPFQTKLSGEGATENLEVIYDVTSNLQELERIELIDLLDSNFYSMGGKPCK